MRFYLSVILYISALLLTAGFFYLSVDGLLKNIDTPAYLTSFGGISFILSSALCIYFAWFSITRRKIWFIGESNEFIRDARKLLAVAVVVIAGPVIIIFIAFESVSR